MEALKKVNKKGYKTEKLRHRKYRNLKLNIIQYDIIKAGEKIC